MGFRLVPKSVTLN